MQNLKVKISLSAVLLVALLVAAGSVAAEGRYYLKGGAGISHLSDIDFESANVDGFITGDTTQEAGVGYQLAVGYRVNPSFGYEFEFTQKSNDIDDAQIDSGQLNSVDAIEATAILANAYYYLAQFDLLTPYVGFGLGALVDAEYEVAVAGFGESRSLSDPVIAFQAIVGLEYPVTEHIRLFSEGRIFSASSPDVDNEVSTFNFNYDNYSLNAGVVYLF